MDRRIQVQQMRPMAAHMGQGSDAFKTRVFLDSSSSDATCQVLTDLLHNVVVMGRWSLVASFFFFGFQEVTKVTSECLWCSNEGCW